MPRCLPRTWTATALACLFASLAFADEQPQGATQRPLSFNRDVRPILSDKCFQCHGPDGQARKADLRLDLEQKARTVITPHKPNESELIARISSTDAEQRMPPTSTGKSLTAREIKTLRRWVAEGAKWQRHWSFLPPQRPEAPSVATKSWVRNPIDAFVLARLESVNRKPASVADKATLIRRVTLDLTGLPPTLEDVDRFLADKSPKAYERVVDRLLKSPAYGERMAMVWLDVARYADSHGYSLDRRRVMWPWRDWVIQAYNQNMPFDQFTVEQLAGDLLPTPTISQRIATGFNRNHPIQSEGGVINEEYRVETVVDRVETTSAAFLGLTLGCCRCHDHKYDPFSQQEFYKFFAFFNNVPETAHVGNRDRQADRPTIKAPSVLLQVQQKRLIEQLAELEKRVAAESAQRPTKTVEKVWVDDQLPAGAEPFGNGGGAQTFEFVTSPDHPVLHGKRSSYRTSQGRGQHGFQNAKPLIIEAGTRLFAYVFVDPKNPPKQLMLQWNAGSWEHRAYWGQNLIPWGKDKTPSRKQIGPMPKAGQWVRLEVKAADVGLKPGDHLQGCAFTQFDGTVHWDKVGVVRTQLTPAQQRVSELRVAISQLNNSQPTTMVMAEMNPRRKTFVLERGQYDAPTKTEVTPGLPKALGELPDSKTVNRLSLARWMTSQDNPLTSRVAVNRYWQMYFGEGLVRTPENFGSQGALPTHPDLLDWLATEFIRLKWNVKAMQKLIVMSATYRQSSRTVEPHQQKDPANRLLARGPRLRLPAEMIRDQAIAVSGLLVKRLGGPSVRPYQPPGLWGDVVYENVPRFVQDHGDKLYRRSMYTYWKRSVPPPNLQILDAPTRESCVLKRSRTNTPQAALMLMNDPTFVEAARKLAERVLTSPAKSPKQRVATMFRLVTARHPSDFELKRLTNTLTALLADYRRDGKAAKALLGVGESPTNKKLDAAEVAAFAAIANVLLGLDEVITKH